MSPDPTRPLPSEEAIRRHAEGDRSPEVLQTLSHAAWEAFHAPWEAPLEERAMPDDFPELPPSPLEVRPLTLDLIEAWVKEGARSAFSHPTRGFLIDYNFSLKSDRCVHLRLYLGGKERDVLVLQWTSDTRVPPDQFVRALRFCNWWNNHYRWPRAMVDQPYLNSDADQDPPPDKEEVEAREATHSGQLQLDLQLDLPMGIHQEAVNALIDSAIQTSWSFWRLAQEDWGL